MYLAKEHALSLLEEAATDVRAADHLWRTAVCDALRSNAPLERIAQHARTTIDTIKSIGDEPLPDLSLSSIAPPSSAG